MNIILISCEFESLTQTQTITFLNLTTELSYPNLFEMSRNKCAVRRSYETLDEFINQDFL